MLQLDLEDTITALTLQQLITSDYMVDLKEGLVDNSKLGFWKSEFTSKIANILTLRLVQYSIKELGTEFGILDKDFLSDEAKLNSFIRDFNRKPVNLADIEPTLIPSVVKFITEQNLSEKARAHLNFICQFWPSRFYSTTKKQKQDKLSRRLHGIAKDITVKTLRDWKTMDMHGFCTKYPFMIKVKNVQKICAKESMDTATMNMLVERDMTHILTQEQVEEKKEIYVQRIVEAQELLNSIGELQQHENLNNIDGNKTAATHFNIKRQQVREKARQRAEFARILNPKYEETEKHIPTVVRFSIWEYRLLTRTQMARSLIDKGKLKNNQKTYQS